MTIHVIHLDDEIQILDRFRDIFRKGIDGREVALRQFDEAAALTKSLASLESVDVFLLDVHLRTNLAEGIALAASCRRLFPGAAILMCSASNDLITIRDSLKNGADDYIAKDSNPGEILKQIESALRTKKELDNYQSFSKTSVGSTLSSIAKRVPHIVNSAVNCIYVHGESGTGKEEVTRLFEAFVPVASPFIKLNCGSIPQSLIASELFGYVKGAFTGASTDKQGLIEATDGGWIFLDEVATLPMDAQVALLRAIENQTIRRVGSAKETSVNFRVISATNEPIIDLIDQGKFRRDLWQRLRETEINLPPLRDRRHEIPELTEHFCRIMRGGPYILAPNVLRVLQQYSWKNGNIRELRNCLRAMTEKSVGKTLTPNSVPAYIWQELDPELSSLANRVARDVKNPRSINVTWQSDERPDYETLSRVLLLEILKLEFAKAGQMSMRAASKVTGIPKSSISAKLLQLIEYEIVTEGELGQLVKLRS